MWRLRCWCRWWPLWVVIVLSRCATYKQVLTRGAQHSTGPQHSQSWVTNRPTGDLSTPLDSLTVTRAACALVTVSSCVLWEMADCEGAQSVLGSQQGHSQSPLTVTDIYRLTATRTSHPQLWCWTVSLSRNESLMRVSVARLTLPCWPELTVHNRAEEVILSQQKPRLAYIDTPEQKSQNWDLWQHAGTNQFQSLLT